MQRAGPQRQPQSRRRSATHDRACAVQLLPQPGQPSRCLPKQTACLVQCLRITAAAVRLFYTRKMNIVMYDAYPSTLREHSATTTSYVLGQLNLSAPLARRASPTGTESTRTPAHEIVQCYNAERLPLVRHSAEQQPLRSMCDTVCRLRRMNSTGPSAHLAIPEPRILVLSETRCIDNLCARPERNY